MTIPQVDLGPWRAGDRDATAGALDEALRRSGFFLLTGHGLPELAAPVRAAAARFFALPAAVKQAYAATVGGRGWLPPGAEANAYDAGEPTPPDLKETFAIGASGSATGTDAYWYRPNVWPAQVPELATALTAYAAAHRALADELLTVAGHALGEPGLFAATDPTWTLNVNRYPPRSETGEPQPGQLRIGAHTDFGTFTLLDREPGQGGLQVEGDDGWQDAPYEQSALTVNAGDLLAYWSGGRWRSARHRVLPPPADDPAEELMSLVLFCETDPERLVTPVGGGEPVHAGEFVRRRLDAITR